MNRKVTWLAVPFAALALTSCVGGGGGAALSSGNNQSESFVDISEQQGAVESYVGALEDVSLDRCEADENGWVGQGTVTNPTSESQNYRLYVAFNDNRDTRGLVQVDLSRVASGQSETWSVEAPIDGDNLTCVLRVERFTQ